jgi:transcriptional regulator with XRE-family HTH domain
MIRIGEKLRQRAQELGLADAEVARRVGLSPSRYANYIANIREPDFATLKRICRVLGTTPNFLLGSDDAMSEEPEDQSDDAKIKREILSIISAMGPLALRTTKVVVSSLIATPEEEFKNINFDGIAKPIKDTKHPAFDGVVGKLEQMYQDIGYAASENEYLLTVKRIVRDVERVCEDPGEYEKNIEERINILRADISSRITQGNMADPRREAAVDENIFMLSGDTPFLDGKEVSSYDRDVLFRIWLTLSMNNGYSEAALQLGSDDSGYLAAPLYVREDFIRWSIELVAWKPLDFDSKDAAHKSYLVVKPFRAENETTVYMLSHSGDCISVQTENGQIDRGEWSVRSNVLINATVMRGNRKIDAFIAGNGIRKAGGTMAGIIRDDSDVTSIRGCAVYIEKERESEDIGRAVRIMSEAGIEWANGRFSGNGIVH